MPAVNPKNKYEKCGVLAYVSHDTQTWSFHVVQCFVGEGYDVYRDLKRTRRTFVPLINPFV